MLASHSMSPARMIYAMVQPSQRPVLRLVIYYIGLVLIGVAIEALAPGFMAEHFSRPSSLGEFASRDNVASSISDLSAATNPLVGNIELLFSLIVVVMLMLPVSWVYMATRIKTGVDQSVVQTMILLPVAVTGVVAMVQHSIALAFSLAGIVASVRFRTTLKRTSDALYIFTAVGVGLAAGIGDLGIAVVLSVFFNATILLLWRCDYGVCPQAGPMDGFSSGKLLEAVGEQPIDLMEEKKKKKHKKSKKKHGHDDASPDDQPERVAGQP